MSVGRIDGSIAWADAIDEDVIRKEDKEKQRNKKLNETSIDSISSSSSANDKLREEEKIVPIPSSSPSSPSSSTSSDSSASSSSSPPPSANSLSRPRVDTAHGFVHQIVATQQDRDEYEKQSQIKKQIRETSQQSILSQVSKNDSNNNNKRNYYQGGYSFGQQRHFNSKEKELDHQKPWPHDAYEAQQKRLQQQEEEEKRRNNHHRMIYSRGGGNNNTSSRGNHYSSDRTIRGGGRGGKSDVSFFTDPRKWADDSDEIVSVQSTTKEIQNPTPSVNESPPITAITEKKSTRAFYQAPKRTSAAPPDSTPVPPNSAETTEEAKSSEEKDTSIQPILPTSSPLDTEEERKKEDDLRRLERKRLIENRLEEKKQEEIKRKEREMARKQRISDKQKEKKQQEEEEKEDKEDEKREGSKERLHLPSDADFSTQNSTVKLSNTSPTLNASTKLPSPHKSLTSSSSSSSSSTSSSSPPSSNSTTATKNNTVTNSKARTWVDAATATKITPTSLPASSSIIYSTLNPAAEEFTPSSAVSRTPAINAENKPAVTTPSRPPLPHHRESTTNTESAAAGRGGMITLGRGRGRGGRRSTTVPRHPVVSLSIDVGLAGEVRLDVYENDDVKSVAIEFGLNYGLTSEEIGEMENIILENMKAKE